MRKIAFITAVLAALAAAVPASGALLAKSCGKSCATLTASGKGSLGVVGSGAEWGNIQSGTIWVRDRTGKQNPRTYRGGSCMTAGCEGWVHGSGLTWKSIGDDGWKVTSKHRMIFSASTNTFWIKLQGPGIAVSGVFDGTGNIEGTGTYTLNGNKHSWPSANRALTF
jgi:hypothetical protein